MAAYDAIVAGAGPVGLTLAIDLGRRGVRCLLLERSSTTLPYPKMDRSNARTMEFYRRIGIADRVRALGYPADNPMDVFLTTRLSDPPIAVLKYPSVAERRKQIAECPNGAFLLEPYQLVSQNKLEPLLKEVAEATPNVTVRYGCELIDFVQDDDAVTVVTRGVSGAGGIWAIWNCAGRGIWGFAARVSGGADGHWVRGVCGRRACCGGGAGDDVRGFGGDGAGIAGDASALPHGGGHAG